MGGRPPSTSAAFRGFDDQIIFDVHPRGMSTREIVGHLRDLYGITVSLHLISAAADAIARGGRCLHARRRQPVR
jgi:putative transposase